MMQASKLLGWQRTADTTPVQHELIIEPGQGMAHYWRDLWRYRELFFFLAWRDIAVRYQQTVSGVAWAVVVLSRLAGLPSESGSAS